MIPRWINWLAIGLLLVVGALWLLGCATATRRARVKPQELAVLLVQFHGAVADQMALGGIELEHYLVVQSWIADEVRVLTTNPTQWEGQMRLGWPRVRSICVPFESLEPWVQRIDRWVQ